jgi:hypothetical protein
MHFAAAALVEPLYRGLADSSVGRIIEGLLRADLGIIDELGFAPLDYSGSSSCSCSWQRYTSADHSGSRATGRLNGAVSCPSTQL